MGYKHIRKAHKVQSVAYVLAGLSQIETARRTGLNPKSVSKWCSDPRLMAEGQNLLKKAMGHIDEIRNQKRIEAGLADGSLIRAKSGRIMTREHYERLRNNGLRMANHPKFVEARTIMHELRREASSMKSKANGGS